MRQLISLVLFAGFCAIAMVSLTGCFDAEHYRTLVKQGKKYDCSSDSDCIDDYKCNVQLKKCQPPLNEELKCNEIYFTAQGMTLTVHFSADNHPSVTIDRTNLEPDGTTPLGAYKVSYQASEHGVQALVEARRGLVKARIGECEFKCIAAPSAGYNPSSCIDHDCDMYGTGSQGSCMGEDPDDEDADIYPGSPEICDGKDNDGDQLTDAADDDFHAEPCRLQVGVCAGWTVPCEDGKPLMCTYGPDYVAEETDRHCDRQDNDCDNATDEQCVCQDGQTQVCGMVVGECDRGIRHCQDGKWSDVCEGEIGPVDEICDCRDNDCDGSTDELPQNDAGHVCGEKCPTCDTIPIIATVNGREVTVCVDRYEASRRDAGSNIPASVAGAAPWTNVDFATAQSACAINHKVLCPIEVWQAACGGPSRNLYPYGMEFQADACNGNNVAATPETTASRQGCVSQWDGRGDNPEVGKLFDMSGNVREWVAPPQHSPAQRWLAGGAYNSSQDKLTCTTLEQKPDGGASQDIGFRCCSRLPF